MTEHTSDAKRAENHADFTRILNDWQEGQTTRLDEIMPLVYKELCSIAHGYLSRERRNHTLHTGALVNEAYMRLVGQVNLEFRNRAHFYAIAARVMRQVLVDYARENQAQKRGGRAERIFLEDIDQLSEHPAVELIELDESLEALAKFDKRKCEMVELRFFGGMTIEETAEVLEFSPATLKREWIVTKAWLRKDMTQRLERRSG